MANLSHDANQLQYWVDVRGEVTTIQAAVTKQELQPRNASFVYITSIKKRSQPEFREGVVQTAMLKRAAECVVSETHRLSTDDEIQAYLNKQEQDQKAAASLAANGKNTVVFQTPKPA